MKNLFKKVCILSMVILLSGCATADRWQTADSITTAIAINMDGISEGNPLFGGANAGEIFVVKLAVTNLIKLTPIEMCRPGLFTATLSGSFGALWNIGVICGSGPAAIPVILALWIWQWNSWWDAAYVDCIEPTQFHWPFSTNNNTNPYSLQNIPLNETWNVDNQFNKG